VTETILAAAHALMSSPWVYLVLFGFAAIDAFFPVVPSESLVITAGVYAAAGEPNLAGVVAVAALGASAGPGREVASRSFRTRRTRRTRRSRRRTAATHQGSSPGCTVSIPTMTGQDRTAHSRTSLITMRRESSSG
jgi:membrane protein DedA with SNARE-associated domain